VLKASLQGMQTTRYSEIYYYIYYRFSFMSRVLVMQWNNEVSTNGIITAYNSCRNTL